MVLLGYVIGARRCGFTVRLQNEWKHNTTPDPFQNSSEMLHRIAQILSISGWKRNYFHCRNYQLFCLFILKVSAAYNTIHNQTKCINIGKWMFGIVREFPAQILFILLINRCVLELGLHFIEIFSLPLFLTVINTYLYFKIFRHTDTVSTITLWAFITVTILCTVTIEKGKFRINN